MLSDTPMRHAEPREESFNLSLFGMTQFSNIRYEVSKIWLLNLRFSIKNKGAVANHRQPPLGLAFFNYST